MKENFPFNTPLEEVREGKARFSKYSSHFSFMTPSMPIPMMSAPTHSHSVYICSFQWRTTDNKRQVSWNIFCSSMKFLPPMHPISFYHARTIRKISSFLLHCYFHPSSQPSQLIPVVSPQVKAKRGTWTERRRLFHTSMKAPWCIKVSENH